MFVKDVQQLSEETFTVSAKISLTSFCSPEALWYAMHLGKPARITQQLLQEQEAPLLCVQDGTIPKNTVVWEIMRVVKEGMKVFISSLV